MVTNEKQKLFQRGINFGKRQLVGAKNAMKNINKNNTPYIEHHKNYNSK